MPTTQKSDPAWMLEDAESSRLQSTWVNPRTHCITCLKQTKPDKANTFRWWGPDRTEIVDWECDCLSQWLMHRYMLAHGVPLMFQRYSWDDALEMEPTAQMRALEYVDEATWFVNRGVSMMFHADQAGTGKTLLLMLTVKALLARNYRAYAFNISDLLELGMASWKNPDLQRRFDRDVLNSEVLAIDGLGEEKNKDQEVTREFIQRMLARVIKHRLADSAPILFTSRMSEDQLTVAYGPEVMDLMSEATSMVSVPGANWHLKARERTVAEARQRLTRPVVLS